MAILRIPVNPDLFSQSFFVILDGATYKIDLVWNLRDLSYYLSLADADELPIVSGHRVIENFDLLAGVVDSRSPPGALMVIANDPLAFGDLGGDNDLLYFEAETVAAL